jgi:hypothetical protein
MTTAVKDVPFLRLSSTRPAAGGRAATAAGGRAKTVAMERTVVRDQGSNNDKYSPGRNSPSPLKILTLIGGCTDSYVKSYREISYIGAEIFYTGRVKNLRFLSKGTIERKSVVTLFLALTHNGLAPRIARSLMTFFA